MELTKPHPKLTYLLVFMHSWKRKVLNGGSQLCQVWVLCPSHSFLFIFSTFPNPASMCMSIVHPLAKSSQEFQIFLISSCWLLWHLESNQIHHFSSHWEISCLSNWAGTFAYASGCLGGILVRLGWSR